jgi:hypothetical protein
VGEATINALIGVGDIESSGMIFAGWTDRYQGEIHFTFLFRCLENQPNLI